MNKTIRFKDHDFMICENTEADINVIMICEYRNDETCTYKYFDYMYGYDCSEDDIKAYIDENLRVCDHCGKIFSYTTYQYVCGGETGTVYCDECIRDYIFDHSIDEEL